jgi:hypothetical protein
MESNMSFQLSESLYPVDEVIGTFLQCLLTRATLHECLMWLWELVYSIPDVGDGLICIYLQFYARGYKTFGIFLTRKVAEYNLQKDPHILADIVCNLRLLRPNNTAYLLNYYSITDNTPTSIYNKVSWMKSFPTNATGVLGSLRSKNLLNIGYYVSRSVETYGYEYTSDIIKQYAASMNIDLCNGIDSDYFTGNTLYLFSQICMLIDGAQTTPRIRYLKAPVDMTDDIQHIFLFSDSNLAARRLYRTHTILPPRIYDRTYIDNLDEVCSLYWSTYCFESVAWNTRFMTSGASMNSDGTNITWPNNSILELFRKKYNMDFNELSTKMKDMSNHDIIVGEDPIDWYNSVMGNSLVSDMTTVTLI